MADDIVTQFHVTYTDSPTAGRLALVTIDNGADHTKPNSFGEAAFESLDKALSQLEGDKELKGVMFTGKHFIFAAGADVTQFTGISEADARRGVEAGHEYFARIQKLPVPTLAAINGLCLGGGVELSLHCDYRAISSGAQFLAFPEVFLGILPGWGGTQLGTQLMGADNAIKMIITNALNNNRMLKPKQAFELGLGDRYIESASFHDDAVALLEDIVSGKVTIERSVDHGDLDKVIADAKNFIDAKVHGATKAPYLALDAIEFAARGGDLDEGRKKEMDGIVELITSDTAQASIYAFDLVQRRVKKQPGKPKESAKDIKKVAVIGAGLMGAQLGALFLQNMQVPLVMKDLSDDVLAKAKEHIDGALDGRVAKGRMTEGRATFLKSLVSYTTDDADLADADFLIEAVLEEMGLKKKIFAALEEHIAEDAILATNTSSLSVAEMASDLKHPERVVGLHFFNPVAMMPLVEVIHHDKISDVAHSTGFDVAKKLKKSAVNCNDAPAFIVNRMLMRFNLAAVEALKSGASFKDIDEAIKGLGLPMGPFELFGLVGIKVAFHTASTLADAFGGRFDIDPNFQRIVDADVPGIYDWENGGTVYDAVAAAVEVEDGATPMDHDAIRAAALEASADEIKRMLDEGVVDDARDVDTGMILGAGFPFFMGGIAMHLDQKGISQKVVGETLLTKDDKAFA